VGRSVSQYDGRRSSAVTNVASSARITGAASSSNAISLALQSHQIQATLNICYAHSRYTLSPHELALILKQFSADQIKKTGAVNLVFRETGISDTELGIEENYLSAMATNKIITEICGLYGASWYCAHPTRN
jgi:hypothetical protein